MLWITAQLTLLLLVFHCLVQCAAPVPARKNEKLSTKEPAKNKLKTTPEIKLPKTGAKPTASSTAKVTATTGKVIQKKTTTPAPLSEFSLDDILFRGRQSNEANAFIKANEQRGKTLETTYEHVREQDLNDIEAIVRRRKGIKLTRS